MAQPVRTPVDQRRAWGCGPKAWFTSCLAVAITSSSSAAGTNAEPMLWVCSGCGGWMAISDSGIT